MYMSYVKHKSTGSSIIAVIVKRATVTPISPSHIRHQSSSIPNFALLEYPV